MKVLMADYGVGNIHSIKKALEIADRAYVLETGNIQFEGTGQELLHDKRVQDAYLGS